MNPTATVIETPRLRLRSFDERDVPFIERIFSDPATMRYIGRGGVLPREAAARSVARWVELAGERGYGLWAVAERERDDPIGWCGLADLRDTPHVEVMWLLDAPFRGRGYATEAAAAALKFGFEQIQLPEIVAIAYPANAASIAVMERIGLRERGVFRYFDADLAFWGVRAEEWKAARM